VGFAIGEGPNGWVGASAVQIDGRVILAGAFTSFSGIPAKNIVRLNTDGTMDESFATPGSGSVQARAVAVQGDGRMLIGGEFTSWSEVLPTDVSHLMDAGMVGKHSTGSYDGSTRHNVTLKAWPTRYRVPTQRARKGEDFEPSTVHVGPMVVTTREHWDSSHTHPLHLMDATVTRLHAPTDRADRRFVGHSAIGRPTTVHAQRRTRQYSEAFTLTGDHLANLIAVAGTVARGKAATWRSADGAIRGTVSVSPKGRYSATVAGVNIAVKGAKTPQGLARHLAPAFN
jgi:hypothetical protein